MHVRLTPRVGGIAIFASLLLSVLFAPDPVSGPYAKFVAATSLLFIVGLAEDVGFRVSPLGRLLAVACASLIVIWLFDIWLPGIGVPHLDIYFQHWVVGIPVTLLVTAGIANGFNLIDGVNGLASLAAVVAAFALSQIASQAGFANMIQLTLMFAVLMLGFFVVNYPFGFIFLGDAGAYTLGFVLSWFGVSLLINSPSISPWAILLTLFWPVADMLLAIYRRYRRMTAISAPDRLHVHQMVMRALEICFVGRSRRHIANPLTTLVLSPFVIAPPVAGVLFWNQNQNAFFAVVTFGILFFASYAAAPRLIQRFRRLPTPD